MTIKIDIYKMSASSRESYLIDLVADLADSLKAQRDLSDYDQSLIEFSEKAVYDYNSKKSNSGE